MKVLLTSFLLLPLCSAFPADLAVTNFKYTFDDNFNDSSGNNRPAIIDGGGTIIDGRYVMMAPETGPTVDVSCCGALRNTYSLEIKFEVDDLSNVDGTNSGYQRIIDYNNGNFNSEALYLTPSIYLWPDISTSTAVTANEYITVTITRDDATKLVSLYADGNKLGDFSDISGKYVLDPYVLFFQSGGGTTGYGTTGSIESVTLWYGVLSAQDVAISAAPPATGGAGGDPHFTTWSGYRYDFHGHCDLILLKSLHFGQGHLKHVQDQGLSVHIRSAPYKVAFSYISEIAVQIGDNILEIGEMGEHYINGELQQIGATQPVAGYPVGSKLTKNGRYIYRVHLGDGREKRYHGQELLIREYKGWITIGVHHPNPEDFSDSIGLMGSFPLGTWLGRDGVTIHKDIHEFGSDWIVQGDIDGCLFREQSPFPDKCELPSLEDTKRRRLSMTSITNEEARAACAQYLIDSNAMEGCIMDVLVADDLEMAANEPL
eukprot:scaffold609_cov170-Amphora_coffeaeformis.AAC.28